MTPVERAKATRPDTFKEELEAHLLHGYVISTQTAFLMGRAIVKDAPHALQADPWHTFAPDECDTWLVWLAAGDMAEFMRHVPYPLPWLAWARREGSLRFFHSATVNARLIAGHVVKFPVKGCHSAGSFADRVV